MFLVFPPTESNGSEDSFASFESSSTPVPFSEGLVRLGIPPRSRLGLWCSVYPSRCSSAAAARVIHSFICKCTNLYLPSSAYMP